MDNRQVDLSKYRIQEAEDSLMREKSDYDDFHIASKNQAEEQYETAKLAMEEVKEYLKRQYN